MQKKISKLYKTLVWGDEVALTVLDTTSLVAEAAKRHISSDTATAALGRTMTGAAYLASWLKEETSRLFVTVDGGGACGKIRVTADGALNLSGYLEHPNADVPPKGPHKLDVGALVGKNGSLTVVRDDGNGLLFTGTSPLVSGEIAEDFSAYFLTSEQRPTAVALGVLVQEGVCLAAGGLFLELLPGASEGAFAKAEREIGRYAHLSSKLYEGGAEEILREFGAAGATEREIRFSCTCSKARAARAVVSLGREEANALCGERGRVEVHCDYCNTTYAFGAEELKTLFREEK